MTGKVKWFNDTKGFGFLTLEGGEDAFVHHTQIRMKGRRTLAAGQAVDCRVVTTDKGLKATNIVPLG